MTFKRVSGVDRAKLSSSRALIRLQRDAQIRSCLTEISPGLTYQLIRQPLSGTRVFPYWSRSSLMYTEKTLRFRRPWTEICLVRDLPAAVISLPVSSSSPRAAVHLVGDLPRPLRRGNRGQPGHRTASPQTDALILEEHQAHPDSAGRGHASYLGGRDQLFGSGPL